MTADSADIDITYYFKAVSQSGVESDIVPYTVRLDNKAPGGEIAFGQNRWNTFLNAITFGLFFKDTQEIIITSSDTGSGIARTEYYISDAEVSDAGSIEGWTEYTGPVTVEPDQRCVVYVRITDNTGNVSIINSDGLVLDGTAPVISGIEDGRVYCSAVTAVVTDANLDTVTLDGEAVTLTDSALTLSPTGVAQTIVAIDKAGNITVVTVTVCDGHEWDEGVVTEAPTASRKGVKLYTCVHCGETRTEEIDKIPPEIIEGENGQWKQGENSTLTFRSNAAFDDFVGVLVDGELIDASCYDLEEGSIVVTLKAGYLATLSVGTHTIGIQSATGTAWAQFTIVEKEEPEQPPTGDSHMSLWIALLFVSGGTIFGVRSRKRKA